MRGPIRILHVAATLTGGVGLNILLLARHLPRDRFALAAAFAPGSPLDRALAAEGVRVHAVPMHRRPWRPANLLGLAALQRLLARERFHVVHCHTSVGGFLGRVAARRAGVPVVVWTVHGWAFHYPDGGVLRRTLFKGIEAWLDRRTDHYIAVSRDMKEVGVSAGVATASKVRVIHHGLDPAPYAVPARAAAAVRRRWGIPDGAPVAGPAGRFEPPKGMEIWVRAAARILERVPEAWFLTVGDGPERRRLESLARELGLAGRMVFPGWQEEIAPLLSAMDCFCMASRWEAFPFVLLEAMAAARPVVATAVGGVPEVLEHGRGGTLVPPGDAAALAEAAAALLADGESRRAMGGRNLLRIREEFSLEGMIERYSAFYEEVAGDA